ncbi:MAG: SsrA-binding protein SmpB [Erysipelotrichaceae bacterium]|jgi:SsrA-binding protein|nr:SsrA-binding protein SmpB [Erysipelotrichaceae bacterium]
MAKTESGIKIITSNKKAHFNYFLSEFTECGIALMGTEIKSLRTHGCSLNDAYVIIRNGEMEVLNMHINPYDKGNIFNHDPLRNRKLLLHKKEIRWFDDKVKKDGFTIVPTRVYLKKGKAKIEIALAKGKKMYDKRETIKQRDIARKLKDGDF